MTLALISLNKLLEVNIVNDLLIQTSILSLVIVIALYLSMRVLRRQQNQNPTAEHQQLITKNAELQNCNEQQLESISVLKQELASSNASISHLSTSLSENENKQAQLIKSIDEQASLITSQKAEISKLSTQAEQNGQQIKERNSELASTRSELMSGQQRNLELSNQCAEQVEKLNQFDDVKSELVTVKRALQESAEKILALGNSNAELNEKLKQFEQTKTALSNIRTDLINKTEEYRLLSNESAEQAEKLKQLDEIKLEHASTKQSLAQRIEEVSALKSQLSADEQAKQALNEKIALLEAAEKRLVTQFENAANKIFKEKTGEFSQQSKTSMDALLSPLKQQITTFSKQVSDVYTNEAKERHALKEEVNGLKALNEQMSKEATALTKALKGDNKKQGTWGEVVLERVLQESGLRLNHEYDTQKALKDEEGSLFKPDVIVHLPGDKDVVIDSKMALTAYERYFNAEDEVIRQQALKEHISSIKNHIKQLTSKNYHDLHGIKSLDYTLMFIPVEPAFNVAIEHDNELIQLALDKNIMLVSPTNLMVALKTINNMWRVEYQNQNAQDIANRAGAIYDKLVNFVDDMKKLGNHLQRAEGSYGDAMKKLSEGRGNLIRKAEDMKGLRISNNKSLPRELVERSESKTLVANG